MKVVHLLPAMEQGGVESVVCDLNRVLTRAGWESVIISKGGRLVRKIEDDGGRHIALDVKSKNPLSYIPRVVQLRRRILTERPDLVCVHSRVPAWLYVGVRKLDSIVRSFGRPVVTPPWITYAHGANSVSKYSEVMTKGDLVVVPSRFLADYLKDNYGIAEGRLRVIPNAVDLERFDPERLDKAFVEEKRREWGIGVGDRVTMSVGRITQVKGLDSLIREFGNRAGAESCGQKLVIVGGADSHHLQYLESLKTLAKEVEAGDGRHEKRIVFAGPQAKVPECLSLADEVVSANTTKPESFGLSIVEAYAMNKPVRAKRFGGAAEVMEAVERAGKPTLREAVRSLYGIELFAERTLAAYRGLVNMV